MDSPPGIEFQGLLKGCNQVLHICRHIFVPAVYDRVIYDRFPVTHIKPAHRLVVVEMPDVALEIENKIREHYGLEPVIDYIPTGEEVAESETEKVEE